MRGTGSGADGFKLLDARFLGTQVDNPSDTFYVGTTRIQYWGGFAYPDFVGEGTGDQKAIMGAICAVKKASFDGVDCVGGEEATTGKVSRMRHAAVPGAACSCVLSSIFTLKQLRSIIYGLVVRSYLPSRDFCETVGLLCLHHEIQFSRCAPAVYSLPHVLHKLRLHTSPTRLYSTSCQRPCRPPWYRFLLRALRANITVEDIEIRFCDGDAAVVRGSTTVNIDAGRYDEEYLPWTIGRSRGTGLIVDASTNVWVRRHTIYDNGVAGLHIMNSNNFTFEATIDSDGSVGDGNVGSLDGQQPIEIIIENSVLLKFQDMRVQSVNDPVMTISNSTGVSFTNTGLSRVETGTCVIKTDEFSEVTIDAEEDELFFEDNCYVKVDTST
ncbi:unnamed protein product [Pylaiella littoralis]